MMTVSDDEFWADGGLCEQMSDRVYKHIRKRRPIVDEYRIYVSFSAYHSTESGRYRDNLDDVAVEGRVQFIEELEIPGQHGFLFGDKLQTDRKRYVSPVVEDPTWLDVALMANDMINTTGDNHHIYLEDIYPSDELFSIDVKSFIKIYRFSMGS